MACVRWEKSVRTSVRFVAFLEAAKGLLVLLAAAGLLSVIHQDLHAMAARLIKHAHLNPASEYPRIFLDAADQLQNTQLRWLALGAALYSAVRFVEAYGLFRERAWAEVLAAGSGAIYVPFELAELLHHPAWPAVMLLLVNLAVVAVMVRALLIRRRTPAHPAAPA